MNETDPGTEIWDIYNLEPSGSRQSTAALLNEESPCAPDTGAQGSAPQQGTGGYAENAYHGYNKRTNLPVLPETMNSPRETPIRRLQEKRPRETHMNTTAKLQHPLLEQIKAYDNMKDKLEHDHFGRWVIIHDCNIKGDYDSYPAAAAAAKAMRLNTTECLFRPVGVEAPIIIPLESTKQ